MKRIVAVFVLTVLLLSLLAPAGCVLAEEKSGPPPRPGDFSFMEEESDPAFRRDMGGNDEETPPGNLRLLTGEPGEHYTFREMKSRYGYPDDYEVNMTGMSSLNISGSAQYSAGQFRYLARKITELAPDVQNVYIVDLRQESHGFVYDDDDPEYQGIALSWYGVHNWANFGMSTEEVLSAERTLFSESVRTALTLRGRPRKNGDGHNKTIQIEAYKTEEDLVKEADQHSGVRFSYLRLAIPDRTFPEADIVDRFIEFVKGIDMNNSWLHFHCLAGMGRTGIMMSVYDMMKNPDVPMADILARQTMTGGSYPLSVNQFEDYLEPYDAERVRLVPLLYEYIRENSATDYEVLWSEWLAQRGRDAA